MINAKLISKFPNCSFSEIYNFRLSLTALPFSLHNNMIMIENTKQLIQKKGNLDKKFEQDSRKIALTSATSILIRIASVRMKSSLCSQMLFKKFRNFYSSSRIDASLFFCKLSTVVEESFLQSL